MNIFAFAITLFALIYLSYGFIDINLHVNRSGSDIAYNFPIKINQI